MNYVTPRLKKLSDRWYSKLVGDRSPRMELLRHEDFLRGLGLSNYMADLRGYRLFEPNA